MKIYDISQEVFGCEVYPGDPAPEKESLCSIEKGDAYNLTAFSMCAHNGTHIDAPYHFLRNGATVEKIPLEKCVGYAFVVECEGDIDACKAESILEKARAAGKQCEKRLLIKGDAVVTLAAAEVFAAQGVYLIGVESQSVGPASAPMEVHMELLRANTVLLEGIRLSGVSKGVYMLCAAPMSMAGADGAPCRAILIEF